MPHHIPGVNAKIENNITSIVEEQIKWKEAIVMFQLEEGNIQRVYLRYIIKKYGYLTALSLINDDMV